MSNPTLADVARRTVDAAKKAGAATAVVHVGHSQEFDLECRNGELENLSEAEGFSLSLTVSREGRRASVHSCDFSEQALTDLVEKALVLCRHTDPDPFYDLPDPAWLAVEVRDLDLMDEHLTRLSVAKKSEMAREVERLALALDSRLQSDGSSVSCHISHVVLANSLGFCQQERSSMVSCGLSLFAEDEVHDADLNSGRKQGGGWATSARHLEDLKAPEELARRAAQDVLERLGARKPKTGMTSAYFEPDAARSLWGHLLAAIHGGAIYRKESFLADRLGSSIFPEFVDLYEDPFLPRGQGSRFFDGEGVACTPGFLIQGGVLKSFLLNCYSARKLAMASNGHSGGAHNLRVTPGHLSQDELLARMGQGVWVRDLAGQGVNMATGDYSRGAEGFWVENGQRSFPIAECTLSGNLGEMFAHILAVGSEIETGYFLETPGLLIEGLTLAGN
jgi:PmbA protein